MVKHDSFSPKGISNRMKAKGLQKLRWYCEMCQKQCRDENGFKCHQTSESHLRQMRIFAEDPTRVIESYSSEFEKNFLTILSLRHHTKRVLANDVYREYISDKQHVHMNSTRWDTLTSFVQYLGKSGKCVVDETEKGWFLQWIDHSARKVVTNVPEDEERELQRELKRRLKQANAATAAAAAAAEVAMPTDLLRHETTSFSVATKKQKTTPTKSCENFWARPGIVVRIVKKGEHYKRKGTILSVRSSFVDGKVVCEIVVDKDEEIQLAQEHLETVIPASEGKEVRVLKGSCRGQLATILAIDQRQSSVRVKVNDDQQNAGTILERGFDAVSKAAPSSSA